MHTSGDFDFFFVLQIDGHFVTYLMHVKKTAEMNKQLYNVNIKMSPCMIALCKN